MRKEFSQPFRFDPFSPFLLADERKNPPMFFLRPGLSWGKASPPFLVPPLNLSPLVMIRSPKFQVFSRIETSCVLYLSSPVLKSSSSLLSFLEALSAHSFFFPPAFLGVKKGLLTIFFHCQPFLLADTKLGPPFSFLF